AGPAEPALFANRARHRLRAAAGLGEAMTDLPLEPASLRPADLAVRQRHWIKRLLPNTMFGRSLLLIVMPLILVQAISAWVFYARHWETVAHRFAADVAAEISLLGQMVSLANSDAQAARLMDRAGAQTDVIYSFDRGGSLPAPVPSGGSGTEDHLRVAMAER